MRAVPHERTVHGAQLCHGHGALASHHGVVYLCHGHAFRCVTTTSTVPPHLRCETCTTLSLRRTRRSLGPPTPRRETSPWLRTSSRCNPRRGRASQAPPSSVIWNCTLGSSSSISCR